VDDYAEAEKLHYCGADMRALAEQLVAAGFPKDQVFLMDDKAQETKYRPLKPNIERQLEVVLRLAEREDLIVVAFSGHGVHLDGKSYLCPTETRLSEPRTMVSLDTVYAQLDQCRATMKIFLVDACRNDPRPGGQKGLKPTEGTKQFATSLDRLPEGILLLTSCAAGQISMEEKEFGHGVFMHYVLEGLQGKADADHNGHVSLTELYRYANRETKVYVSRKFNGYQTPALKGDISDDFEIARVTARGPELVTGRQGQTSPEPAGAGPAVAGSVVNSIGMRLVPIPAGEFQMGSTEEEASELLQIARDRKESSTYVDALPAERPQHRVRISQPFYLAAYKVTQAEYQQVIGSNPSYFSAQGGGKADLASPDTARHPVESVSWADAVQFCRKLSALPQEKAAGRIYRLPTEAEWEYACRAGSTGLYCFGDDRAMLGEYAWFDSNIGRTTRPVGQKKPNRWGLYDMHGNVWEWCADWYSPDYYKASPPSDPPGPSSGSDRSIRGGGWISYGAEGCRSAFRLGYSPTFAYKDLGFRVAMDAR